MSLTGLFHYQVYLPKQLQTNFGKLNLRYSNHALNASKSDRYGYITIPTSIDTSDSLAIEVESEDGVTTKVVYRVPYNETHDLILVVQPDGFVRTVWLNDKSDKHRTLNIAKYVRQK